MTGKLIAYFLSPLMQSIASYLKNSYDLVSLFVKIPPLPEGAVLLVADIDNLYPNIPIREAFDRVSESK